MCVPLPLFFFSSSFSGVHSHSHSYWFSVICNWYMYMNESFSLFHFNSFALSAACPWNGMRCDDVGYGETRNSVYNFFFSLSLVFSRIFKCHKKQRSNFEPLGVCVCVCVLYENRMSFNNCSFVMCLPISYQSNLLRSVLKIEPFPHHYPEWTSTSEAFIQLQFNCFILYCVAP